MPELSELWLGVLLGVGFSIPIGLAINIISPYITRRIDKRSAQASAKRARQDDEFRASAARLAKDRPSLYTYLLETLIRIAYIGAIFAILSGGLTIFGYLTFGSGGIFALSQLFALIGTIIILNIARPAVLMIREIRKLS